jgi:translation initiation factor IF-3
MTLSKSNNARLRKYAMRIKNSSLKILIDDNDVNIKVINYSHRQKTWP